MKMVKRSDIESVVDAWLQPQLYQDYCENGLQVQGSEHVQHLATAVTASQAVIEQTIAIGAELLMVHHGIFWHKEPMVLTGLHYRRCRPLILNDVSLLAYHLPLDGQQEFGNNTEIAKLLGFEVRGELGFLQPNIGFWGQCCQHSVESFTELLTQKFNRKPTVLLGASNRPILKVAWCSGAAQDAIVEASKLGVDAFISGEMSERTYHLAQELDVHYFAAGHHATERLGIQALGKKLAERFAIKHTYIEIDNPV